MIKSSVIIDELPTIYFRGLDNLIATGGSNKVAVCLEFQDYLQLNRDHGDKENKVIQNPVGNIFLGQVVGETAKNMSERFGKVLPKRQSIIPHKNILLGDDIYKSDTFFIKPVPRASNITIKWKLISKSFKDEGVLTINVSPEIDLNIIRKIVDSISEETDIGGEIKNYIIEKKE